MKRGTTMTTKKKIILVWVIVALIAIGAFSIAAALQSNTDKIVFNVLPEQTFTTADFEYSDLDIKDYLVFGFDPIPRGYPKDILLQGLSICTPKGTDGALLSNERAIFLQFNNPTTPNRKMLALVSETNTLKIDSNNVQTNRSIDLESDEWSSLLNQKLKFFRYEKDDSMFAIMVMNNHFWRIEGYQMTEKEFVATLRTTISTFANKV